MLSDPLGNDLFGGYCYPPFEQSGHDPLVWILNVYAI